MTNQKQNQSFTNNINNNSDDFLNKELEGELEIKEYSEKDLNLDDEVDLEKIKNNEEKDIENNSLINLEQKIKDSSINSKDNNYIKIQLLKIQGQVNQLLSFLDGSDIPIEKPKEGVIINEELKLKKEDDNKDQKIVEGVFTGEEMIGPDGKRYSIPSNYASKSKLLEGDILKLIIKKDGTFIYKQIGPVNRARLIGTLIKNDVTDQYYAMVDGERWKLLKASVTFFKGEVGDEIVILVPEDSKSKWAAVENIVKKS